MPKKLTIEFVRESFESAGYTLLTEEYINAHQKLEYICSKGHRSSITWHDWAQEKRCAECAGNKKLTIEFIKENFESNGYILLTKKYRSNKQKLEYICPVGHKGSIAWTKWQQNRRCAQCSGNVRLTIEFVREQLEADGYTLLTEKYINSKQKLEYICPNGHRGTVLWLNWNRNHRCQKCYLENNKGKNHSNWKLNLTEEDRQSRRLIPGYTDWRDTVKERDNFTCQICKKRGGNLESHHIEAYNSNPELRTELSNGTTLCKKCHDDFHHQYGHGYNTREQLEEFIKNQDIRN